MVGVLLSTIGTFFDEIALSIGKSKVNQNQISIYAFGILNIMAALVIFIIISLVKQKFVFSLASLPTFTLRLILEIILTQVVLIAISQADRSTFGFIRVLTIPLLLLVDLILGYKISIFQLAGIGLIVITLIFIFTNRGVKKRGSFYTFLSAILAVATISLYKYDITYFNSVEAEQTLICLSTMIYLLFMSIFFAKENPFSFFLKPIFLTQSLASGLASFILSFAYIFAPASVILASLRSSAILWTVASGRFYFKEQNFFVKVFYSFMLIISIFLLIL